METPISGARSLGFWAWALGFWAARIRYYVLCAPGVCSYLLTEAQAILIRIQPISVHVCKSVYSSLDIGPEATYSLQ